MFILTAKLPRRKTALCVAAAALLCCCVTTALPVPGGAQTVSASAVPDPRGVRSAQDRLDYLSAYGWQVDPEPLSSQELLIPKEMDGSYEQYLQLQTSQGFHLEKLAGKRVKRYTYAVLNHPTRETDVQAHLLIHRNTVVGGEILSTQLDGFLHGLTMP